MTIERVTFFPAALPSASPLVADATRGSAIQLLSPGLIGAARLSYSPLTSKGASQEGETALDLAVPPRILALQAFINSADQNELNDARAAIGRAMVGIPVRVGGDLDLGRLLIEREGEDDREIYGMPRSHEVKPIWGTTQGSLDAEWFCPYPYFQPTSDTTSEEIAVDASETIANSGDVDAPFTAKIYGPATEVTLTDLTTGEFFTVAVTLADDTEWLQVETTRGRKRVRKYTDVDTFENAIAGLSTDSRLFVLRPGNNSVKLEATGDDANTHAVLVYRPRFAAL